MTDDDLNDIATWLAGEQGSNRHLNTRLNQLSGSELACEHVAVLLEAVKVLRETGEPVTANVYADYLEERGHGEAAKALRAGFPLGGSQ
jgi:hypothetical protein